jgi:hypothetical protein
MGSAFKNAGETAGIQLDTCIGGESHNIANDESFALFVQSCLELVCLGTAFIGLPCSTFVWLSRGVTKRHSSNRWQGDITRDDVFVANTIGMRVVFLVRLLVLGNVQFIIEQPLTSCYFLMLSWKRFARVCPFIIDKHNNNAKLPLMRKFVWLGHWAAASMSAVAKPTVLWGCSRALSKLQCQRPKIDHKKRIVRFTTLKYVMKNNKRVQVRRVYGLRGPLKSTQQYPEMFCKDVAMYSVLK